MSSIQADGALFVISLTSSDTGGSDTFVGNGLNIDSFGNAVLL